MAETLKKWEEIGRSYRVYIKLEKRLSENTVESYMRDLRQFAHFILRFYDVPPRKVEAPMIERYLALLYDQGREKTSQARALSGIRSFYNYLMLTDVSILPRPSSSIRPNSAVTSRTFLRSKRSIASLPP